MTRVQFDEFIVLVPNTREELKGMIMERQRSQQAFVANMAGSDRIVAADAAMLHSKLANLGLSSARFSCREEFRLDLTRHSHVSTGHDYS